MITVLLVSKGGQQCVKSKLIDTVFDTVVSLISIDYSLHHCKYITALKDLLYVTAYNMLQLSDIHLNCMQM